MGGTRRAAVAGSFYPGDRAGLESMVRGLLAEVSVPADAPAPKALIAPHAGFVYSGPVAASAYARVAPLRGIVKRVVLLGPCHRVPVRGLAASGADWFETPLGRVPLDPAAIDATLTLPGVATLDVAHLQEHSLEVHLPFLQVALGDFALAPFVVGDAPPAMVAAVLERLWGGPETLIVVSTDLSHYLDYDAGRALDATTAEAIERLDASALGRDQACGRMPVAGLLHAARARGLRPVRLDIRNSGDTAGPRDRVVGYGSWMFVPGDGDTAAATVPGEDDFGARTRALLKAHGPTLLRVAAATIEHGLTHGRPLRVNRADHAPDLAADGAAFVTLKRDGRLRGCIGSVTAHRPLVEDVAENAFAAAFRDPRFGPLRREEKDGLELSMSVLSPHAPFAFTGEADLLARLRPHVDGLIIEDRGRRALFLPVVWEQLPDPRQFLAHLKAKAGFPRDHWSPDLKAWRFVAEEIAAADLPDPEAIWT